MFVRDSVSQVVSKGWVSVSLNGQLRPVFWKKGMISSDIKN